MAHAEGYTNGYTMVLVLAHYTWQHLAEYRQNTAELGLLGRTIPLPKPPEYLVFHPLCEWRVVQMVVQWAGKMRLSCIESEASIIFKSVSPKNL